MKLITIILVTLIVLSVPSYGTTINGTVTVIANVTPTPHSSSSSGGGSGSGGVITNEDYNNIEMYETIESYIRYNISSIYNYTFGRNPIYAIIVTGTKNDGDIAIRVEVLKSQSSKTAVLNGVVYKYINILSGTKNIGTNNIIQFKVPVSWMEQNGIAMLYRWNNNEWQQLSTSFVKSDDEYYYYQAVTEGFSSFAIAKPVITMDVPTIETSQQVTVEPTIVIKEPDLTAVPIAEKEINIIFGLLALLGIFIVFGYIYIKKNIKSKDDEHIK